MTDVIALKREAVTSPPKDKLRRNIEIRLPL